MSVQAAADLQTFSSHARALVEKASALGELSFNRLAGGLGRLGVTGSEGAAQALNASAIASGSHLEHLGTLRVSSVDAIAGCLVGALAQAAGFLGGRTQLGQLGVSL